MKALLSAVGVTSQVSLAAYGFYLIIYSLDPTMRLHGLAFLIYGGLTAVMIFAALASDK